MIGKPEEASKNTEEILGIDAFQNRMTKIIHNIIFRRWSIAVIYYAKSSQKDGTGETVREHLQAVETLARIYGKAFDAEIPADLCGLFHDFGKYSAAFQKVLQGTQTGVDHATGGAAFLYLYQVGKKQTGKNAYRPVIEAVAAHHTHLISQEDLAGMLETVLRSENPVTTLSGKQAALCGMKDYQQAGQAFQEDFPDFRFPPAKSLAPQLPFIGQEDTMLYTRMLFSCLTDADYTASANDPPAEGPPLDVSSALKNLYAHCEALRVGSKADPVLNQFRNRLFDRCGQAGEQEGGLFTLTAPTGTGKTLALLHFALRHCQYTGKRRIIVVLPFLSLIEQSARIYRQILPQVLEDHSQSRLPEEMREHAARWDQPFLITTSVRFFESLFSDHPSDCRKLHNLAGSVILFDEAQSLPVSLLTPTLKTMKALCNRYGCSVVFSTATQPDYTGLREITWPASELLPEHRDFYQALRRTSVRWELDTPIPLEEIAERMAEQQNVCAIVNLRAHARKLYYALSERCPGEELFLLSTDLCPAHRTAVIQAIHQRQKERLPCRVVSTQCIEAGVDLDFDCLYRALAPLEAIIQAAGRCNRNGRASCGEICVFVPEEDRLYPDAHYENGATIVRAMAIQHPIDIHDPENIRRYYQQLFGAFRGDRRSRALEKAIAERDFPAVAQTYRLIDQRGIQILVPYEGQKELYEKLRTEALKTGLTKALLKQAAPLMVTCYDRELAEQVCEPLYLAGAGRPETRESPCYVVLSGQESCYDEKMGFCPPEKQDLQNSIW